MSRPAHETSKIAYSGTFLMLGLALAFPVALMIFNPTLMFERGWEQYVGTSLFVVAVIVLGSELLRLKGEEACFEEAPALLALPTKIVQGEHRVLPARIKQLSAASATPSSLMELNREASGLDQEQAAGRFTITKYILYLLPVIGFIGTVEGISHALMNISRVLPMVKDLDGFMNNLTSVTSALQVAFDSTLLALFLSAALMLVQTLVHRRSEDLLARVDRWVVDHVLSAVSEEAPQSALQAALGSLSEKFDAIHRDLASLATKLGEGLGANVDRFSLAIDRLNPALDALNDGTKSLSRIGQDLQPLIDIGDALRKGTGALGRVEMSLATLPEQEIQLDAIRRGIDRQCTALDGLSNQWASAFEKSSKATQEHLARTLGSLKDALDMLNVSMEQGNSLYRSIVKSKFSVYRGEEAS